MRTLADIASSALYLAWAALCASAAAYWATVLGRRLGRRLKRNGARP